MRFLFGNRDREAATEALREVNRQLAEASAKVESSLDKLHSDKHPDKLALLVHQMRKSRFRREIERDRDWRPGEK